MNRRQAIKILGLTGEEDEKEIKRKYRKLMHQAHPDNNGEKSDSELAAKINSAYDFIIKDVESKVNYKTNVKKKPKAQTWKGKENRNAYCKRPIFHNVEDFDGNNIGTIEIARGKYIWSTDEEFSMFLKSIYETSKQLLDDSRPDIFFELPDLIKQKYLAELTYLLTSQFIDGTETLKELGTIKDEIYKINGMVELATGTSTPKAGTALYPAGISNHKLYLRNRTSEIVGYLSFKDDRLYYVLIPLFEQKLAQVKMKVVETKPTTKIRKRYVDLDLWIKLNKTTETSMESVNMKIDNLLKKYKSEGL